VKFIAVARDDAAASDDVDKRAAAAATGFSAGCLAAR